MSKMPMPSGEKVADHDRTNGPAIAELFDDTPKGRERRELLRRLEQVEKLFDRNFSVLGIRFGWDAVLGLVPVAGDTVAAGAAGWIYWKAQKLGVPGHIKRKMISNIAFDYIFGAIPVLGTVVDVAFKANTRNVRMLKEHLLEEEERDRAAWHAERKGPPAA
ncbi:DUF4112 domain-containing protein [Rhizobium sp. EC-SD404]|uniref:DUF4112 domain-containing protein n=1 Tax=Rhizobium sp. EC-SD404 TaxID=2038389 RepID=UPI0012516523|nr:DUF4112 domain-containing protein [Rhizobium sp. EC-SD404]VVT32050.1 conserved hypothetical protein [Rhizobium sp. EC-SD404]